MRVFVLDEGIGELALGHRFVHEVGMRHVSAGGPFMKLMLMKNGLA